MDAASLLASLRGDGHNLWLRNGRLVIAPPPPQCLWPAISEGKEALLVLLAGGHEPPPILPALPPARPGALSGDPPAPIVHPVATRTLALLELAGAQPSLRPDGQLELARPDSASPDLRAATQRHQDNIVAVLTYRALLETRWPVT